MAPVIQVDSLLLLVTCTKFSGIFVFKEKATAGSTQ